MRAAMYFKEIKEQITELKEYAIEYKRIKDALETAFDNINEDAFSVAEKHFDEIAENYDFYSTRAENLLDSERDYINEQLEKGDIDDNGHDKRENKLDALYCEWEDVNADVGNIENEIRGYIQDVIFLQTMENNVWIESAICKGERKKRVMNCAWNETHAPKTTTTSGVKETAIDSAKLLETLARWGRLSRARKDVVPRVLKMARVTVARLDGTWKRRAESIESDARHSCYTDADAADARRIAKTFYALVEEVLDATKDDTATDATTTDATTTDATTTTPPAALVIPTNPTATPNKEKEVPTMTKEQTITPRPLSLVKNPESVRSIKRGELAPRLVKSADAVKSAAPVSDAEKSRLYVWKDGKKAYATTPAAAPEYRLRTILKVAHAYFDRCTHEWIFTYQKEVVKELVNNGARLVESRENVPGFDPAKLDLHERVKWEFKQGRIAWIEGRRFNLTSEPRGYYNGAPLSKRNSELVFRIPTYFLTEKTAEKVAKETGLTISLKPKAEIFAVRVPRFEKVDDDGNGIGSPVNYYWEKAYKQEDFDGLPQKSLESPALPDVVKIHAALRAAPNMNLLGAFRYAASKVASLANLTSERRALAVEIAACIALSSVGLVPRDFIKNVEQYAQQWRAALFASNGAKVALDKGQEAAIEILTSIGVKVPTTSTAPAAKA